MFKLTAQLLSFIKKAEWQRIDAFELWCWWRLLRVRWTARRSNQSILKEISLEYSLEGLMLKLKLQYFGHLMWRTDSFKKTLMLGKIESGFIAVYNVLHAQSCLTLCNPMDFPCPSPTPGACSNSCPSSRWCHQTISFSVHPFSSCLQSFPASGSFPMNPFFISGGWSIGVSASASLLPINIQDWCPLGLTGLISL